VIHVLLLCNRGKVWTKYCVFNQLQTATLHFISRCVTCCKRSELPTYPPIYLLLADHVSGRLISLYDLTQLMSSRNLLFVWNFTVIQNRLSWARSVHYSIAVFSDTHLKKSSACVCADSWNTLVSTVARLGPNSPDGQVSIPSRGGFFLSNFVHTGSGTNPASYPVDTVSFFFPGSKAVSSWSRPLTFI
jgi:hypothetical protein